MAEREVRWVGDSLNVMRAFPDNVKTAAGHALFLVQRGQTPSDVKALSGLGSGVCEIREWGQDGTYRVIFVARFETAVYVLHAFQKKTQGIDRANSDLIKKRYADAMADDRRARGVK